MNFFLQFFKLLGVLAALVFGMGWLSKAGIPLSGMVKMATVQRLTDDDAPAAPANDDQLLAEYSAPNELVLSRSGADAPATTHVVLPNSATDSPTRTRTTAASARRVDVAEWIDLNAAQTYLEAERGTMSPGVILATGIYFLNNGRGDMGMDAAEVAAYLADVRENAPAEAKSRMKYIANSQAWFEGLKMAGFDADQISAIYKANNLARYDKQMYSRHVERKVESKPTATTAAALTADKRSRSIDLADAYNDYANRPQVREKNALPKLKKEQPLSSTETSVARREAEAIRAGSSKTYDDARLFWSVLKETIALEQGYPSWDAYRTDHTRNADRAFQSRSNLMALGGVMRVSRASK